MPAAQDEEKVQELHRQFESRMAENGLRSTAQRRLVTDVFFRARGHFSIEEVLAEARAKEPKVGHATVYRTLRLLEEFGLASARQFGDGITRYELADEEHHHDHLICTSCTKIVEFEDQAVELLQERVAERHGFTLANHKHELYGVCKECQDRPVEAE